MIDIQKAAEFRLLLRQSPNDINLLKEAIEFFLSAGILEEASTYLLRYDGLVKNDAWTLAMQGALLGRQGDHLLAREYLEKSIEIEPGKSDVHYNLALTCLNLGDVSQAILHLRQTVKINPGDAMAWNDLGVMKSSIGHHNEAEGCFYKAIEAKPDLREAYINLTQVGQYLIEPKRALGIFHSYLINHDDDEIRIAYNSLRSLWLKDEVDRFRGLKVSLIAFSDFETDPDRKLRWGDYWFKKELGEALERLGCELVDDNADLLMHLFGVPVTNLPNAKVKAIWIHSHPDLVTPELLRRYDKLFCLSGSFIAKIEKAGFKANLLIGGTAKRPQKAEKKYDLVFVGNTKGKYGRKIIQDLEGDYTGLKVWGEGWENILPTENIGGIYYENARLPELYASAKISLNDHHEDMRREGFLNPRVFDILASGGFVISDQMIGLEKIFGKAVPTYTSPQQLRSLINKYLSDEKEREELALKGREISLRYSFDQMAAQVLLSIYGVGDADQISVRGSAKSPQQNDVNLEPAAVKVSTKPSGLRIGLDASGRSNYEIMPVISAYKLVSEYLPETELHICGDCNGSLPSEVYSHARIKRAENIDNCNLYVDCRLKFTSSLNVPETPSMILSPNMDQEFQVKGQQINLKVESRIDLERGRIWEYNDLVFKLAFAAENMKALLSKTVKEYAK